MAESVYENYANALLDLLLSDEKADLLGVRDALRSLNHFLFEEKEGQALYEALSSYALPEKRRKELLREAILPRLESKTFKAFLELLFDKHALFALPKIEKAFRPKANAALGIAEGTLFSAKPLSAGQKETIERSLGKRLGLKVVLEEKIDPSLIGGVNVLVGETLYEGSLEGSLERLRARLLKGDNL